MKYFTPKNRLALLAIALGLGSASCSRYFAPREQAVYTKLQIDSTLTGDSTFLQLYAPYREQLEAEMNRVVGYTDVNLTHPRDVPETRLGNFFADALLAEGKKRHPDAELSFGTKGGLRIELQKGTITMGNLFELMPFENEMVLLELSGKSLLQLAQFIAATDGQPVAGLRMRIKDGKAIDITVAGKPLELSRTYKLITYDYLANGGDNSRGLSNPVSRTNLGLKVREALITYVGEQTRAGKHINTQLDGRITHNQ
ncbi:hypothetical protein GCM10007415_21570 [Parapedobacter pyrenivorans]|uniref:5'-Nucleotidase C-terminal domain-containing protein n=1 Tax=Parapedobacter pyrenivorans TaxID=1305674 RepID=A0A917HQL9_9SPHI|nr:5'-nucleotidase [Parapedobacter pyrenivorans]GGG87488.1 hypothetical protein GCM10007415_21570 [Parapedobacter pyrenivorans]